MKKGVLLESFRKPFRESVKEAAVLGLDGVQIFAKSDAVHDGMTATEVKEVKRILGWKCPLCAGTLGAECIIILMKCERKLSGRNGF